MTDDQNNSPIKHSVSRLPSQETIAPWLNAKRKKGTYPKDTNRTGKWLIFVPTEKIDNIWLTIKEATEEGILGSAAKVSTAMGGANSTDPNENVICVYTYDWADEQDVMRIREELRKMGITRKIPYKTDEATRSGKYRATGHQKISKYWE
ncbi:MAG: putative phosphothreonine lyase domain-containing protein [Crinalium sp.]